MTTRWTAGLVVMMIALTAARGLACEVICPAEIAATETDSCHQGAADAGAAQIDATHVCDHAVPTTAMTLVKRAALDSAPAIAAASALVAPPLAASSTTLAASARAPADPPARSVTILRI